jgi:hypothetical protein
MFLKLVNIPKKLHVKEFSSPILWHSFSYKFLSYRFLKFALKCLSSVLLQSDSLVVLCEIFLTGE